MLQFGQYKGKSLAQVSDFDYQYITWIANNIPNLSKRLDGEDFQYITKVMNPISYIQNKYGDITKLKEEKALKILKDEGLLRTAHQYVGNDGALHYNIETLYANCYGSTSGIYPTEITESKDLVSEVLQLMDKYSKKHFEKHFKK